jgi:hypothetical protein
VWLARHTKPYRDHTKVVPEDRDGQFAMVRGHTIIVSLVSGALLVQQVTMEDVGPELELQEPHGSYVTEVADEYQVCEVHVMWIGDM